MQKKYNLVIADTSCLILLDKIGELDLLRVTFGNVFITPEIANEYSLPLPEWIYIKEAKDKHYNDALYTELDAGEASAFALAIEHDNSLIIIDDLKARFFAEMIGLQFIGTLGIIISAKQAGHITFIKPILDKISKTNFRISPKVISDILKKAGE